MDEIELKVHDMSSTLQPADAYALVLEEVNGNLYGCKISTFCRISKSFRFVVRRHGSPLPAVYDAISVPQSVLKGDGSR